MPLRITLLLNPGFCLTYSSAILSLIGRNRIPGLKARAMNEPMQWDHHLDSLKADARRLGIHQDEWVKYLLFRLSQQYNKKQYAQLKEALDKASDPVLALSAPEGDGIPFAQGLEVLHDNRRIILPASQIQPKEPLTLDPNRLLRLLLVVKTTPSETSSRG